MQARSLWTKVVTLTVLALLIAPASGLSAPARAPANTHLGVPPGNLVTLVPIPGYGEGDVFAQLLPDGAIATNPFVVPSGKVLIVTDINNLHFLSVSLCLNGDALGIFSVEAGKSYQFTAGFVVPAGRHLTTGDIGDYGRAIFVRGYLMAAQ